MNNPHSIRRSIYWHWFLLSAYSTRTVSRHYVMDDFGNMRSVSTESLKAFLANEMWEAA